MKERLEPRLRISLGSAVAIGPGKAAILEGIAETGSIAAAARRMRMSYRRAWFLVRTMNACFREPLVEATKGGLARGGARLTATGQQVLQRYRRMEARAVEAAEADMRAFRELMSDQPPED
jgi:molybdate transport system regulatory protein